MFRGNPREERLGGFMMAGYLFVLASQLHLLVGLLGWLQPCAHACVRLLTSWSHASEISWNVQALLKFVLVSLQILTDPLSWSHVSSQRLCLLVWCFHFPRFCKYRALPLQPKKKAARRATDFLATSKNYMDSFGREKVVNIQFLLSQTYHVLPLNSFLCKVWLLNCVFHLCANQRMCAFRFGEAWSTYVLYCGVVQSRFVFYSCMFRSINLICKRYCVKPHIYVLQPTSKQKTHALWATQKWKTKFMRSTFVLFFTFFPSHWYLSKSLYMIFHDQFGTILKYKLFVVGSYIPIIIHLFLLTSPQLINRRTIFYPINLTAYQPVSDTHQYLWRNTNIFLCTYITKHWTMTTEKEVEQYHKQLQIM